MNDNSKITQAVVLSGGASQGAYHVGVLKALLNGESPATNYQPLTPDVFTGTSAGSVNAAAMLGEMEAGNPDPAAYLEELWLGRIARTGTSCGSGVYRMRGNPSRFTDFGCLITRPFQPALDLIQDIGHLARESVQRGNHFLTSTERVGQRLLDQLNLSTFVSVDRFQEILNTAIRFDLIQKSRKYIRIGAVRWDTGFLHYFENRDMTVDVGPKIIQASSAVPGFFPRVNVNGIEYGDGGVIENSPLQGAVEANADVIHVVTSLPSTANIPAAETINTLDTMYRMLVINVSKSIRRDIERYRNVNDALLVLEKMREAKQNGAPYQLLQQIIDRIMRQNDPDYRRITIHVHLPPDPIANILDFVNFDREYLQQLIRKGYSDTIGHNCKRNGCVVPDGDTLDTKPIVSADLYGEALASLPIDPGINF